MMSLQKVTGAKSSNGQVRDNLDIKKKIVNDYNMFN